jgi:hypothetical protein
MAIALPPDDALRAPASSPGASAITARVRQVAAWGIATLIVAAVFFALRSRHSADTIAVLLSTAGIGRCVEVQSNSGQLSVNLFYAKRGQKTVTLWGYEAYWPTQQHGPQLDPWWFSVSRNVILQKTVYAAPFWLVTIVLIGLWAAARWRRGIRLSSLLLLTTALCFAIAAGSVERELPFYQFGDWLCMPDN